MSNIEKSTNLICTALCTESWLSTLFEVYCANTECIKCELNKGEKTCSHTRTLIAILIGYSLATRSTTELVSIESYIKSNFPNFYNT